MAEQIGAKGPDHNHLGGKAPLTRRPSRSRAQKQAGQTRPRVRRSAGLGAVSRCCALRARPRWLAPMTLVLVAASVVAWLAGLGQSPTSPWSPIAGTPPSRSFRRSFLSGGCSGWGVPSARVLRAYDLTPGGATRRTEVGSARCAHFELLFTIADRFGLRGLDVLLGRRRDRVLAQASNPVCPKAIRVGPVSSCPP